VNDVNFHPMTFTQIDLNLEATSLDAAITNSDHLERLKSDKITSRPLSPKIQAIIWFLENGGKQALITNPENIGRALKGETGTWIVR